MNYLSGKRVLITGCCGTVGAELVRVLLQEPGFQPAAVVGLDNNESELFFVDQQYLDDQRANFFVTDIRDRDAVVARMRDIDVVFHTAALKHVVLCERSPFEAVQTNIHGVQNVISTAQECGVEKVVFTSSDKAVNPTNVMGTSKLMGERITTAAASHRVNGGPIFVSTRFGNVLGSNGSVIPIFHQQIANGGPVTLTDPDMTRFVMSVEQSVRLIIDSAEVARGGEVFVTKMPVVRIKDLAEVMIAELAPLHGHAAKDVVIKQIGVKPGEKLYEELMSGEETRRAVELDEYYAVLPAFRGLYRDIDYNYPQVITDVVTNPYVSTDEPPLGKPELTEFLRSNGLLDPNAFDRLHRPDARYWPGDKEEVQQ